MSTWIHVLLIGVLCGCAIAQGADGSQQVNPFPRQLQVGEVLKAWRFDADTEGWQPTARVRLSAAGGALKIQCLGHDPYLSAPCPLPAAQDMVIVRLRARSTGSGCRRLTSR